MKIISIIIIFWGITLPTAFAALQDDYILLINSYNSHYFWANTL